MSHSAPSIGVGLLGYAFMGKAHSNAYQTLTYMTWPPPLRPELIAIGGRDQGAVVDAAARYGFERAATDWQEIVDDPRISLFDNCGPNGLHAAPTIAAAEAGKHVICEKPLGREASESYEIWQRVAATGVKHMCGFNYRFVPAIRLAREIVGAGELGEIRHYRARYLQAWGINPDVMTWRFDREQAGSGALGDLGTHIIDLARHLVGEIAAVAGITHTFVSDRAGHRVDVDDAFEATVEFENGPIGTLEASRVCPGRANHLALEINGSKGSIAFNLERLNELQVALNGSAHGGFQTILATEPNHPFMKHWWPPGHIIGWEHTFIHELHHLLEAIRDDCAVRPYGADLEDGYRAAEICDAIIRSSDTGAREQVTYRPSAPSYRLAKPRRVLPFRSPSPT
ncbi:MAG: Gfo/Idh/MocA family oxidoreductase [Alphaproteobacteria bacterium]|nr:Gfo/Idh/MocA family oxidoreductase [Alphaproteobacteria bacterium]